MAVRGAMERLQWTRSNLAEAVQKTASTRAQSSTAGANGRAQIKICARIPPGSATGADPRHAPCFDLGGVGTGPGACTYPASVRRASRFRASTSRHLRHVGTEKPILNPFRGALIGLRVGSRRRVLLRWVQIALKPASKTPGLHGVFIRGKGLKYVVADSAFERMQVDARAC